MSEITLSTLIRARGFRVTPQRLTVLRVLKEAGEHLSPGEIIQRAQERMPAITEATVYRTLDFLTRQGLVLCAHLGGGHVVYELGDDHHHLLCRMCGQSVAISHDVLGNVYHYLEEATGYQLDTSHITFFGLCPDCQTK